MVPLENHVAQVVDLAQLVALATWVEAAKTP
jgi:hypothetical protein